MVPLTLISGTKVILDKNGNPVDIRPYDRNVATKLIEDFMLAANETVAAEYYWRELPFVYRTHEQPDSEKYRNYPRLSIISGTLST